MKILLSRIICTVKNFLFDVVGLLLGYSACKRCYSTWNHKRREEIPTDLRDYDDLKNVPTGGMSPLCRQCFNEADADEIVRYCRLLWKSWPNKGRKKNQSFQADIKPVIVEYLKKENKIPGNSKLCKEVE